MKDPMIVLDVLGKRAEMTHAEAREMLRLLKQVFGDHGHGGALPIPFPQPVDIRPYTPPVLPESTRPPWMPDIICGSYMGGATVSDCLARYDHHGMPVSHW